MHNRENDRGIDWAHAMALGQSADCAEVREIVERHRRTIDRWFYPRDVKMQWGFSDLCESDTRFAANIDKHGDG